MMKTLIQTQKTTILAKFKKICAVMLSIVLVAQPAAYAQQTAGEPAQSPLLVPGNMADPNVMMLFDISGSMNFIATPDALFEGVALAGVSFPVIHPADITMYNFYDERAKNPDYNGEGLRYVIGTGSKDALTDKYVLKEEDLLAAMFRSSQVNKAYYDPAVTYKPWIGADGKPMRDDYPPNAAPIYAAPSNQAMYPGLTADLTMRKYHFTTDANNPDISSRMCVLWLLAENWRANCTASTEEIDFSPAMYFIYKGSEAYPGAPAGAYYPQAVPDPEFMFKPYVAHGVGIKDIKNYEAIYIADIEKKMGGKVAQLGTRTDCKTLNSGKHKPDDVIYCTQAEEYKNFTNWYVYYRDRKRIAVGALTHVLSEDYGMNYRLGWAQFTSPNRDYPNTPNINIDGLPRLYEYVRKGVRDINTPNYKEAIFDGLFTIERGTDGGTPTRLALQEVGEYFKESSDAGPWGNTPGPIDVGAPAQQQLSCRRAYTILMTDGGYNDSIVAIGNVDNINGPATTYADGVTPFTFKATAPFRDGNADTLADMAFKYWVTDLRPDLPNDIPARSEKYYEQGAFWQHMVTHTVGFAITGNLKKADEEKLMTGQIVWPSPGSKGSDPGRSDDLWHAAVNGHGKYFSANAVDPLLKAFAEIFDSMGSDAANPPNTAISSDIMKTDNELYSTAYTSGDWNGDLINYNATITGVANTIKWKASDAVPTAANRNIWIGTGKANPAPAAIKFDWNSLGNYDGLQAALVNEGLVNYLRGDKTDEGDGTYRKRTGSLGDIVNSTPVIVQKTKNLGYSALPISVANNAGYFKYLTVMGERKRMIFAGANDGMLHAFDAANGKEVFAYIPNAVAPKLKRLSLETYTANHQYYVDGPLRLADVYWGDATGCSAGQAEKCWRNVLLGSTGAGAKSVFALDVTNPSNYTGTTSGDAVMWELSDKSEKMEELGFVMQEIQTGYTQSGRAVAIFGNGPYSKSGKAVLYVVDLKTGKHIATIPATGGGDGNGLMGVALMFDKNRFITGAYAGDIRGNLWRFDLNSNEGSWGNGSNVNKLFTTKDNRAITQAPVFATHPKGGKLVLFGTGKLYDLGDTVDTGIDALYGIWDNKSHQSVSVAQLISRKTKKVTVTSGGQEFTYYDLDDSLAIDWNIYKGWTMPLKMKVGQRSLYKPEILGTSNIIFDTTVIGRGGAGGQVSSCEAGAVDGIAVLLNLFSGGRSNIKWDTNNDGIIDGRDGSYIGFPIDGGSSGHTLRDPWFGSGENTNAGVVCPAGKVLLAHQGIPFCADAHDDTSWIQLF